MNRNDYDTDVTVFSPQGRIFQVEYAMEAVNQGSACVGLATSKYVVLAALKRSPSKLAAHQRKVFPIDDHMGVAISGLTADARSLCKYMRGECLNHKYVFGSVLPVGRLMSTLADKMQECTQSYVRRPYGVGMLVAGADKTGAHLYQTCPSGNVYEFTAHAIGARAQSARTYLEKFQTAFEPLAAANDRQSLLLHALRALASCTEAEEELSADNASLGVATLDGSFEMIDGAAMAPIIAELASFAPEPPAGAAASAASSSSSSSGAAGSAGGADVDGAGDDEDEDDDMAMA